MSVSIVSGALGPVNIVTEKEEGKRRTRSRSSKEAKNHAFKEKVRPRKVDRRQQKMPGVWPSWPGPEADFGVIVGAVFGRVI